MKWKSKWSKAGNKRTLVLCDGIITLQVWYYNQAWRIGVANSHARIARAQDLEGAKTEVLVWAEELLSHALTEVRTIRDRLSI